MAQNRTLKQLSGELVAHPFFPLLFIGKAVETAAFWLIGSATLAEVGIMTLLAFVATILWAASNSIDVDFDKDKFVGE